MPNNLEYTILNAKYIGGSIPKEGNVDVWFYKDSIRVPALNITVQNKSIKSAETTDGGKHFDASKLLIALPAILWKTKHFYTFITYADNEGKEQTLIFDFGKNSYRVEVYFKKALSTDLPTE